MIIPIIVHRKTDLVYHQPMTEYARICVIADIHGCAELLNKLLLVIEERTQFQSTLLITLGDYIDRGPNSKGVIDCLLKFGLRCSSVNLLGNHEAMLLDFLRDSSTGWGWWQNGGQATVESYGVTSDFFPTNVHDFKRLQNQLHRLMPREHITFLQAMPLTYEYKDYFFVHAGVKPGISLHEQSKQDLLWMGEGFLDYPGDFGKVVVHGHRVVSVPEVYSNRIALDTGSVFTKRLTCLVIESDKRYFLQAHEGQEEIVQLDEASIAIKSNY